MSDMAPWDRKVRVMAAGWGAPGNALLAGVLRYVRPRYCWSLRRGHVDDKQFQHVIQEPTDGVVGMIARSDWIEAFRRRGIPVVSTTGQRLVAGVHRVSVDDDAVGRLAAEHLRGLGLQHFAAVSVRRYDLGRRRVAGFRKALPEGCRAPVLWLDQGAPANGAWAGVPEIGRWLLSLPRPLGVFAMNDGTAEEVTEACRLHGLFVPDDVAVLGVDNDETLCECTVPPVTSIMLPFEQIGYRATQMLDDLMNRRPVKSSVVEIPPVGIKVRQSTDVVTINDPAVARAVRFIRDHAFASIGVPDVVAQVPLCRSLIERRFKAALGQTIYDYILHCRVQRASELLARTDMSIEEVASAAGFGSAVRLSTVYRARTGQTPTAYRRQFALR